MNKQLKQWKQNLKKKHYKTFLNSKYWKEVKLLVLNRDNYKCVYCNSTNNLQVHHLTYKNHYKEKQNLKDLVTLCDVCHKSEHKWENKKKEILKIKFIFVKT